MNWKEVVRAVAPGLATALGGPLAGGAVKALASKLLPDSPNATEDDLAAAVSTLAPADYIKIREAEMDFAKAMKQVDIDIFKLETEDRQSARANRGWAVWAPQIGLAALYHAIFTLVFYLLFFYNKDYNEFQKAALNNLLGSLGTGLMLILSFYFGGMYQPHGKEKDASPEVK